MTPPHPHQTIHTVCPACGKGHNAHPEFGPYCTLHCLSPGREGRIKETPSHNTRRNDAT